MTKDYYIKRLNLKGINESAARAIIQVAFRDMELDRDDYRAVYECADSRMHGLLTEYEA